MKAVVKYAKGPKNVELREVPEPSAGRDEVKIQVEYVGICGTDLHIYNDHYLHNSPVIMGHEFSGVVVEVGEGVSRLKAGDWVTSEPFASVCGVCLNCRTGSPNLCLKRLSAGSGLNGGMTKYCVMPQERVHLLPKGVSLKEGALAEPLACCVHAVVDSSKIKPGDFVVVSGPGVIGLLSLQLAKLCGAKVLLVGTKNDKKRLELGLLLGADLVVDEPEELLNKVIEHTETLGADVVIECAGSEKSLVKAVEIIRKGGTIIQLGLFGCSVNIKIDDLVLKEISLLGMFASNWSSWRRALLLIAQRKINVESLVDSVITLDDWTAGFEMMERKETLKILMKP